MHRLRTPGGWIYLLLAAAFVILNVGMLRGASSIQSYVELTRSRDVLGGTVEGLRKETDELKNEITRLRSSPSYAKKVLRDKYHVTEPDEDIVFFAE